MHNFLGWTLRLTKDILKSQEKPSSVPCRTTGSHARQSRAKFFGWTLRRVRGHSNTHVTGSSEIGISRPRLEMGALGKLRQVMVWPPVGWIWTKPSLHHLRDSLEMWQLSRRSQARPLRSSRLCNRCYRICPPMKGFSICNKCKRNKLCSRTWHRLIELSSSVRRWNLWWRICPRSRESYNWWSKNNRCWTTWTRPSEKFSPPTMLINL